MYFAGATQTSLGVGNTKQYPKLIPWALLKTKAALLKFEMRIARGKLKGLSGSGLRIAIQAVKNDWSAFVGACT
jgi:hypothetical protein